MRTAAESPPAPPPSGQPGYWREKPFLGSRLMRYGAAIAIVALAIGTGWVLPGFLGHRLAYLILYPAVMLSAIIGGFGPGLVAALASIAGVVWFHAGGDQVPWVDPAHVMEAIVFFGCSVAISALVGASRRTQVALRIRSAALLDANAQLQQQIERRALADAIVESSDDAIITKDLKGIITSWNQGAARIFGYAAEETVGQPITMLVPADRREEEQQILARVRRGERIDHFETQRVRSDGTPIDISLTISPLRDAAGAIIGVSKIAREITERVQRERLTEFLANLNREFEMRETPDDLLGAASAAVGRQMRVQRCFFAEWSQRSDVVSIARDWCAPGWDGWGSAESLAGFGLPGWPAQVGSGFFAINDLAADRELGGHLAAYAALGIRSLACSTYRRKDASTIALVVARDQPLAWRTSDLEFLGTVIERVWPLVERARSEQALRLSERQLRLVTDMAPVFLAHIDRTHRYQFVNQTYARRFGREVDEVIGRQMGEIIGREAYDAVRDQLEEAFAGRRVEFEDEINCAVVGRRWVHVVFTPERSTGGEVIGVMTLVLDVNERKSAEREIERARDHAVAASRAKDDFLAALSHELRTPLNPVLLIASEAAENRQLPSDVRRDFLTIRKSVELEARLIDDLLDLTRITHGKLPLERRPVEGAAVLNDALSVVQPDAAEKRIALTVEPGATRTTLHADGVRLQQVFWNVLKNAVKFTPPGGRIIVRTANAGDDGHFTVSVEDSGIGMTAAELARVFDAFVQGDHAAAGRPHRFGGMGLGLTISRMIVQLHGGDIRATSGGPGAGSTFTVELPVATAEITGERAGPMPAVATAPAVVETRRGVVPSPRRILVVEDHSPTRDALASLLRRRNYEVLTAGTVAEARERAESGGVGLVVSDIGLPDGDGCELMAELREKMGLKGIALTGYGMDADIARTAKAGFAAHLTKPVRVQALDAALTAAWKTENAEVRAPV